MAIGIGKLHRHRSARWLDAQRIAPSQFTSSEAGGYLVVRTEFQVDAEAEAFADRFAGRMPSN